LAAQGRSVNLRDYLGTHFGGIEVVHSTIHNAPDGMRYLVIHGDHFDLVVTQTKWIALLGDKAYDFAIAVNRIFNAVRRRLGFGYWSLSKWAKLKVKNAVSYIGAFEKTLVAEARRHDVDGVICGHIHLAAIHRDFGIQYVNCGDLGGELHRDRRARRRADGDRHLDADPGRGRRRRCAGRGATAARGTGGVGKAPRLRSLSPQGRGEER
jgi:UDP-2,3-diacylglucosamine pyrophosphatase LpxH